MTSLSATHVLIGKLARLSLIACACVICRAAAEPSSDTLQSPVSLPFEHASEVELARFESGKSEFGARWVPPFISGGHWGRGPHSNAESCIECHPGNGRGRAPNDADEEPVSLVLRLAVPGKNAPDAPQPHTVYGTQLNRYGVTGTLIEEGDFRVAWTPHTVTFDDGEQVTLRKPAVNITALWFGPLGDQTIPSLRLAQPVFGLGLLEAIPESTLQRIANSQKKHGLNGRINYVRDAVNGNRVAGRFGHKALHPTLTQQVAAAFIDEIGVTTSLYPDDSCSPVQSECARLERLSTIEARNEQLVAIVDYLRLLAPPPRRNAEDPAVVRGAALFEKTGCADCHVPQLRTGNDTAFAVLGDRDIYPYSDLLLHDMGENLADAGQQFIVAGREWRTPPLWGLGLRTQINGNTGLLHDGRARNVTEAILWHGGEAQAARAAFMRMPRNARADLLAFLDSL